MKEQIKKLLLENGIDEAFAERLAEYGAMLEETNRSINLTRITSAEDIVYKHFLDSLTAEKYIKKDALVIDIGTGGGIPGIPLAIARPDIKITLLDATENKINCVKGFAEKLGLKNVSTVWGRAEELAHTEMRGSFDVSVSRAVAPLFILTEISAGFIKKGGTFISYKGMNAAEEAAQAEDIRKKCGLSEFSVKDASVGEFMHKLVIAEKTGDIPEKYPRSWAKIKKSVK